MEAAGSEFLRGMQYLAAARRLEGAGDDVKTRKALARLAGSYRTRAVALMSERVGQPQP